MPTRTQRGDPRPDTPPTAREREVLALAALGHSNAEIGRALYLAPASVKCHIRRTSIRLRANDRTHAVAIALSRGYIEPLEH
ncbi:hypothetical protein B4N89_20755 [Embleya scabrispora]|uniref:HTH luxR-type domain-containing protein n=1 Tax=Embleya scabrispora TaxID=159449 RepID=A0A1T3P259_9ACTN|nr:helix-turn-helix transcriptional regulator [Embleya scabrispora]OPC83045.1 hypothetical protein B4N89_20755 [Embleya scabrispora]